MGDAIERLGGTREKFIGDAVFAVFGWPQAHDDDPVRAALAALEIRATLLEPEDGGEPLEVRIGLATGEVVAAARGDGTGDQAVTGEAITTAARIQGLARPGGDPARRGDGARRPRPAVGRGSWLGRPPWPVAGGPPLRAERPIRADRPRLAPADPGYAAGRSDDGAGPRSTRAQAGTALGTRRRRPRTGEAGMGKSRLVADVESEARALGFAWTWTESVSYGRGEPYRFGRQFAQLIADEHGVDSGSYARKLLFTPGTDEAALRRYGGAIAAVARDAAFSGWEAEAVNVPDDPVETATILTEVAAAYVQRMLETDGPRVVVLDDLHWLDTSSTGMVELLVDDRGGPAARDPCDDTSGHASRAGRRSIMSSASNWTAWPPPKRRSSRRWSRAPHSTRATPGGSTSGPRATPCSSARPCAPRSRTAASNCVTGGWCSSNRARRACR